MSSRRLAQVLAGFLFSAALAAQPQDREAPYPTTPGIRVSGLPREPRETLALSAPAPARGSYREYTVMTPSRKDRGVRRIVAVKRAEFHYTKHHYRSFRRIIE